MTPEKYLPRDSWSAEHFSRWQKDSSFRPIDPEWTAARNAALVAAGFDEDASEPERDPGKMTAQDHLDRLQGAR